MALRRSESELGETIRELYRVYEVGPLKDRVGLWLDMPTMAWERKAVGEASVRRVGELSREVYMDLSWHAMCFDREWEETMWYFLPRMFENTVADAMDGSGECRVAGEMFCEILGGKRWRGWGEERVGALVRAWVVAWRAVVEHKFKAGRRASWRCWPGLALFAGVEVEELRGAWRGWAEETRVGAVVQMVEDCEDGMNWEGEAMGCWMEMWGKNGVSRERRGAMEGWLLSREVRELLERTSWEGDDGRKRVSDAELFLQMLAGSRGG